MSARVELLNIASFRDALRRLPEELQQEADVVVEAHAMEAARAVQQGYPEGPTGNLKRGVTTEINRSKFYAAGIVKSRAKHAFIFEKGTQRRQTAKGYNRGAMPEASEPERAIPKFIRIRARMTRALVDVVRRAGFEVSE